MIKKTLKTRFAPSPTGYLHLGHVLSAIYVWEIAARENASVILRIEDHDRSRYRKEYEDAILDDLKWLGFMDRVTEVHFQKDGEERYQKALERLIQQGQIYACDCSRQDIKARAQSRENSTDELRYDQFCRNRNLKITEGVTLRWKVETKAVTFKDGILGEQTQNPSEQCGDFSVRDRDGCWSYQFCVVVDDLDQEIDLVIRGEDILPSTGRQILLRRALKSSTKDLIFYHHPLLTESDGKKLSKRFLSESIRDLKSKGATREDILKLAIGRAK